MRNLARLVLRHRRLGEWNWYLPPVVARFLRISEPDHTIDATAAAAVEVPGTRRPAAAAGS